MTQFRPGGFQAMPPVVKNLLIINAAMVLIQAFAFRFGIDLADYLGLHYWKSHYFKPWQFITHMFLHGSASSLNSAIMHLFSNMLSLWIFGSVLENVWGAKRFLLFYLICGVGAAFLHMAVVGYEFHSIESAVRTFMHNPTVDQYAKMIYANDWNKYSSFQELSQAWQQNPGNDEYRVRAISYCNQIMYGIHTDQLSQKGLFDFPTVGASGAVFGILFAFGYLFPNVPMMLLFLPIPIKAKYFVAAFALYELYAGIQNSAGDNVAHFAHLGGMLVAYILLRIWNKKSSNRFY